jgi:para-aminobenzoate synthetase / 4-amino-4-deoxychorismate lyase
MRRQSAAGYGAIVATGDRTLLSFSPELFFTLEDRDLTCRPMKGTAARRGTAAEDRAAAAALARDAKQRAENLMIVDLMRNDMSRVAKPGSVTVPHLFTVETYPTIHQLTSTVTATLSEPRDAIDVLEALFPCGSITGAPKLRAMEIIADVEHGPRGVYTGSIGRIDTEGAAFNVAIRTLIVPAGASVATLGLGSGIVADSDPDEEWEECLAKGAFVTAAGQEFDLIETMAFNPEGGILRLDKHIARMKMSAETLDFAFSASDARRQLRAVTTLLRQPKTVRLLLEPSGVITIQLKNASPTPDGPVAVRAIPLPVTSADFRLRHKTTDRSFYDHARHTAGTFEVLFIDAEGFLTEGSFTSLFVKRGATLITPPLLRGLLPGVLRAELIDTRRAVEGDVTPADLEDGFYIGNAVRGLLPAVFEGRRK